MGGPAAPTVRAKKVSTAACSVAGMSSNMAPLLAFRRCAKPSRVAHATDLSCKPQRLPAGTHLPFKLVYVMLICVMHDGLVRKQQKICCKASRLAWACNGDVHNTGLAGEGLGDLHGAASRS